MDTSKMRLLSAAGFYMLIILLAAFISLPQGFASTSSEVEVPANAQPASGEVAGDETVPVLEATKIADKESVNPGETVSYTITVENTGEASAINVELVDTLPAGFETREGLTTVESTLGNIAAGASTQLTLDILIPQGTAPGNYTNIARISADNLDSEVEARHTLQVVEGKVLGDTGPRENMLLALLAASVIGGALGIRQIRGQSRFAIK